MYYFFIDAINSVIELINDFKPGKDIELLERVPMPADEGPAGSPVVGSMGDNSFFEKLKGTKSVDTEFGTNPYSLKPMDRVNLGTNSVGVGVNTTNINQNTTLGSFLSSKNDDKSRLNLYADDSP